MTLIGIDAYGLNAYKSYTPAIRNIKYIELQNAIYDEVHIRENTSNIDTTNIREEWQKDTLLLAKFLGDLEAGNINNAGIQIDKFAIKRRKPDELKATTLGYKDFINNNQFIYQDYTQLNEEYIYSIVPVGENGLEGLDNSIIVKSDFAGWFVVDKDTNDVLAFDKFISTSTASTTLNQGRVQIDTLSRFPSFFYTDQDYHEFQLQAVFIPEQWQTSGKQYEKLINQFVRSRKPFLVKASSGEVYICDVSQPSKTAPLNTYSGYDYMELTLNFTEIMTYEEYLALGL